MKKLLFISLVTLLGFVLSYCGPDPGPEPTPSELQIEKLAGALNQSGSKTWNVASVTFEGSEDRTADWAGFTLTFSTSGTLTGNTYSTSGAVSPGPWPSSGTWSFGGTVENPNINQVVRNDGLEVSVSVSETTLSLTFSFDEAVHTGGRVEALSGEYVFTFTSN